MKVLVATTRTQGSRQNDFCHALPDELVKFPTVECDRETIDGSCGCKRSMSGLRSLKSTTTVRVAFRAGMTVEYLACRLFDSYVQSGWTNYGDVDSWKNRSLKEAAELARIAQSFPIFSILERRGEDFIRRLI